MATDTTRQKRPWWQRGPLTALWLALLFTALAHAKPLFDSGLATEETRTALRALAVQFAILTGVMSVFFWLGTIPHKGHRRHAPAIASTNTANLSSEMDSAENGDPWSHLEGYKLASGVGFGLGIAAVGFFLAPDAIADGRITIIESGLAVLVFLVVLWATLSLWAANELRHDDSGILNDLTGFLFPIGCVFAGAELLPESLAHLWNKLLRRAIRIILP